METVQHGVIRKVEDYGRDYPVGACPSAVKLLNPYDKYFCGKDFNVQEKKEFGDICQYSYYQIVRCYKKINQGVSAAEFRARCYDCPYASTRNRNKCDSGSNRYPYFIDGLLLENGYDPDVGTDDAKHYLYFITDGEYVKIGHANNVSNRLRAIQTANARKISVFAMIPLKSKREALWLEERLHYEYRFFRKEGEWFDILHYLDQEVFSKCYPPVEALIYQNDKLHVSIAEQEVQDAQNENHQAGVAAGD